MVRRNSFISMHGNCWKGDGFLVISRVMEPGPVSRWLETFGAALARNDINAAANFFDKDSYWCDRVAFTWNIKTFEGRDEIKAMLAATLAATKPSHWTLAGYPHLTDGG